MEEMFERSPTLQQSIIATKTEAIHPHNQSI